MMICFDLDDNPLVAENMWEKYSRQDYSEGNIAKGLPPGYRAFVAHMVPEARVTGSAAAGILMKFDNEFDYTWFILKWS